MAGKTGMAKPSQDAFVSKGYSFASSWDHNAPLTEQQQAAIIALSHVMAERPFPVTLVQQNASRQDSHLSKSSASESFQASWHREVVLLNSHQFYKWFTELETAMKSEMEEKYRQYVSTLTEHLQTCDVILQQVDDTLSLFDELQTQHRAVATKTKTVHDACERLVMEKERLVEFAEVLQSKLNYFNELENVATQFYSSNMTVGNVQFLPLLRRLDDCISYVASNPQYADSGIYLVKFQQLQSRALGMVRSHVQSVLKNAASQVQTAIRESASGKATISEGAETSVLYVRFKAAANEMKPVMKEIESRSSRREYAQVLADCHNLYCEQRLSLVKSIVQQRISEYAKNEPLASLTRSGCAYLMQVCQLEHQLFDHFFPSSSAEISNLVSLMDPLCTLLYDTLRPKLIHEADLDLLCELVDILKGEVLEEQLVRRGDSVAGLRPTVFRILADVRERLIFRTQMYVRDEIANYLVSAEDVNYPAKLELATGSRNKNEVTEKSDAIEMLYPPLERTLSCLSKLYRCLEPAIFTGLAQDIVGVCSTSLQRASKLIAKQSSALDAQLFLIKHLLILREQIAPFDIEFAVTHKELDFSHVLEHLRRILKGQASIFDWTRSTSLARTFSPRVLQNQVDAKKELEKSLKTTCEEFIMAMTKLIVEPLLSFVTKVAAVKLAMSSSRRETTSEPEKPIKSQAFATPEKIAELVQKVNTAISQELPVLIRKIELYLQNPSTRAILFKPVKSNIVEAHAQLLAILKSDYSADDIGKIGMLPLPELQAHLDSLS